jgi:hypothetical protein
MRTQFDELCEFVKSRKVGFKEYPFFYIYLMLIVIGIGGFGIWSTLYIESISDEFNHKNINLALMGFSLPITATLAIDIFKINAEQFIKYIFQVLSTVIPLFLVILFVVFIKHQWVYIFSGLNVLFSLSFWWIINSKNPNLCDESFYTKNKRDEQKLSDELKGF